MQLIPRYRQFMTPLLLVMLASSAPLACRPRAPESIIAASNSPGTPSLPQWEQRFGLELKQTSAGLTIKSVAKNSTACVFGLVPGDIILKLNNTTVASHDEFEQAARTSLKSAFSPWCLDIKRQGQALRLPYDCDWRRLRRQAPHYLCDPSNMHRCGFLSARCT